MTPDELVERVSLAIDSAICDGDQSSVAMELTSEEIKVLASAAIAVLRPALRAEALEEAAKVADGVGQQPPTDNFMHDTGWDGASLVIAAAIRALVQK